MALAYPAMGTDCGLLRRFADAPRSTRLPNARLFVVPLVVPNTKANPRGRRGADRVSAALARALINAQMSGFGNKAEMRGR